MADAQATFAPTPTSPARREVAITAHDSNAIADIPKAVFVGTGGNITARAVGSSADVVYKNVVSGSILPVQLQYIRSTGTTAADFIGWYG